MHNFNKVSDRPDGGCGTFRCCSTPDRTTKAAPLSFLFSLDFPTFQHFFLLFCCLYFDCRLSVFWGEKVTMITPPLPLAWSYSPYDRLFAQLFKQIFRPGVARRAARFVWIAIEKSLLLLLFSGLKWKFQFKYLSRIRWCYWRGGVGVA